MANTKNYGLAGVGKDVQFGKGGARVKENSGKLEMRNVTDDGYINVSGADPVDPQDFVTKAFFETQGAGDDTIKLPADGAHGGAIESWVVNNTTYSTALDDLNEILGLLVPPAPANFPDSQFVDFSASDNPGSNNPRVAAGVADNTSGGTVPTAGSAINVSSQQYRITNAGADSLNISNVGPGKSGTLTSIINGSVDGTIVLSELDDSPAVNNSLELNANPDYPAATPGFWRSISARILNIGSAAGVAAGWNRVAMDHNEGTPTIDSYVLIDTVPPVTPPTGGVITEGANTKRKSSGIDHYETGSILNVNSLTSGVLSTLTYADVAPVQAQVTNAISSGQDIPFANFGLTTPIPLNTGATAQTVQFGVTLNGANTHTSGQMQARSRNTGGTSGWSSFGPVIHYINGTAKTDEVDETALQGSLGGSRIRLTSNEIGDTPASLAQSVWDQNQSLAAAGFEKEGTIVGGVMKHDTSNYTTGYLPAALDYSAKNADQYVTFKWSAATKSLFSITITGTYSGLWIGMPGISDNAGISPNAINGAWWDAFALYDGAGVPGGTGNSAGCANGAVATGSTGTVNITFGTQSSTNATNNEVIIRFKLTAGQSITAISVNG